MESEREYNSCRGRQRIMRKDTSECLIAATTETMPAIAVKKVINSQVGDMGIW